jgi:hypothetical protein
MGVIFLSNPHVLKDPCIPIQIQIALNLLFSGRIRDTLGMISIENFP